MQSVPWQWRAAVGLAIAETVALVVYAIAIAIAARDSRGATMTATGWEVAVYLAFAVLLGVLTFGLMRRSALARTPFLVAQAFVLIVGWTVFSGDGTVTKTLGALIALVGIVGLVVSFSPAFVASLDGGESGRRAA